MPKMKTHSSLKDRFKITGTGKVKRYKAYRNHLLSHKSGRAKRVRLLSRTWLRRRSSSGSRPRATEIVISIIDLFE